VPKVDQLLEQLRVLAGKVVALRAVVLDVVERPPVLGEVAPVGRSTGMDCFGLPAVAPNRSRAQHDVELARLPGLRLGVVEAVGEAGALERPLGVAPDHLRRLDAEALVHGRDDIAAMRVLMTDLALGLDALGPVHDHRVGDTAFPGVALEELARRVERERPTCRVVVVRVRRAEDVEHFQVVLHLVHDAVEEHVLVDRPVRAALA